MARGAVTGDRVFPDTLGGGQIDEASLGRVPSAATAGHAATADRAALADRVEMATRAALADRAELADRATVASGLRGVVRKSLEYTIPTGSFDVVDVACDAGTVPSGGGWISAADSDIPIVTSSGPLGERRWLVGSPTSTSPRHPFTAPSMRSACRWTALSAVLLALVAAPAATAGELAWDGPRGRSCTSRTRSCSH